MRSGIVQFQEDLTPLMQPIDSVHQHPDNYNEGDVEVIVESIIANTMYRPIYVHRETKEIIAGNHTWLACKQLEAEVIPVIWVDGGEIESIRKMLVDNKSASLARPNVAAELALLERLATADDEIGLVGSGYREADIEQLRALNELEFVPEGDFASWPTLCFQVPPHVKNVFQEMTDMAQGDRERFELMLKMAGWDGKAHR